jgi:hypothetical protein
MEMYLFQNEIVDMRHMIRFQANRKHDIPADSGLLTAFKQLTHGSVKLVPADIVKITDTLCCLSGNGIRIDMCMYVNDLHFGRLDVC